ncbi:MAG: hypothetical protein JWP10_1394 [Nocardioidaceae bacterium]|nr:hypothetical protein [Nocardioidaceae bacterium]
MSVDILDIFTEMGIDTRPDSELTHEEILARNVRVVDLHFHTENPDEVEKAVALYTDDIVWEAPSRGVIMTDRQSVLDSYRKIFQTLAYRKAISLRRFATEQFVFDDQIAELVVVGDPSLMPNLPFETGDSISVRLVHCFELRDGRIAREIAYELWRKKGSLVDNDFIPDGSPVELFPPIPGFPEDS